MSARLAIIAAAWLSTAACLDVNFGDLPTCSVQDDCAAGLSCIDEVCQLPAANQTLAVRVGASAETSAIEFAMTATDAAGKLHVRVSPATWHEGHVEVACGSESCPVAAQLSFTRASAIAGLSAFVTTAESAATGTPNVRFMIPAGDGSVTVEVTPSDPLLATEQFVLDPASLTNLRLMLGENQRTIHGSVRDSAGPVAGYRVVARGHFTDATTEVERIVSSTAITDADGIFVLSLSAAVVPSVTIQAQPDDSRLAPWLRRTVALTGGDTVDAGVLMIPDVSQVDAKVIVVSNGDGVGGATIALRAILTDDAYFETSVDSNDEGVATIPLLVEGAATRYRAAVLPPLGSSAATRFGTDIDVTVGGGVLEPIELATRVPIRGKIRNVWGGYPTYEVTATLTPAVRATLNDADRLWSELATQSGSALILGGEFVVLVDATANGQALHYDLRFDSFDATMPSFSIRDVTVTGNSGADIGQVVAGIPRTVTTLVTTADGAPVPDADVRLFASPAHDQCFDVPVCVTPADLLGQGFTSAIGRVHIQIP